MLNAIKEKFFPRSNYRYHIDRVSADGIEGWVYHKRRDTPCKIQVLTMDGELLAEGVTDHRRPDMQGRECGFCLEVDRRRLVERMPGRAALVVDGIRLSTLFFFAPVDTSLLEAELLERHEILSGLKLARLERENEQLSRRVAELEQLLSDRK